MLIIHNDACSTLKFCLKGISIAQKLTINIDGK